MRLSDKDLYILCKKYGHKALEARRKFAGLLPEVYRRRLYEQKGFGSIFEFAARLAGMSREHVQRVLQLERKFEDKPVLKEALIKGEVSVNKLARVASIATKDNQEELANKAETLSKNALETYVRDEKIKKENGSIKTLFGANSVPGHRIELSEEVHEKLYELQQKGIDINQLLLELLQNRELEIAQEKEKLSAEAAEKKQNRYIPAKIRKLIKKEQGTKCGRKECNKPARQIHHIRKFSITKSHDPRNLKQLCNEHHELEHAEDFQVQRYRQSAAFG